MQCMRATVNSTVARFHNCVHAYKIKLPYNQTDLTNFTNHTQCMHVVPISTSGMLAYILTDCCRGTGEGQTEKEDTKSG